MLPSPGAALTVAVSRQGGQIKSTGLLAALLAAACTDAASPPEPPGPTDVPVLATEATATTIALWGFNGTLPPQSGTQIGKEFNPQNPPLGSTVIATFVWVG
ncbi:MAG TPA: hypothetical protein VGJ80_05080, partial [Gemmatimonadales bacterium]